MSLRAIHAAHLAPVLRWSREERVGARTLVVAAIGMAAPVAAGLAFGRPAIGFTIGLGAMLLAGEAQSAASANERPKPLVAILPALLAAIAATLTAPLPWRDAALVVLAALAAIASGYSRPVAVGAIRFLIYFVLCASLLESAGANRGAAALLFGAGALWNMAVRTMLGRGNAVSEIPDAAPARASTPAQRRAWFRRTLGTRAGWQFPVRIAGGLTAAIMIRDLWPSHHFGWVVLTVALLTQRPLERLPVKITQRALGTAMGVAATWAILAANLPLLALGLIVCVLATLAPFARAGNYLAWSAVSSPVILLVMDLGRPIETALLTDRLTATLTGAAIVLAGNWLAERWTA